MLWHAVSEAILEQATKGIPDTSKRSRKRQPKTVCIRNLLYIFQSREPYRIFKSCKESTRASNLRLMYPPRVHFTSDVSSTTRSKDTSPRTEKKNRLKRNFFSFHTHIHKLLHIYISLEPRIPNRKTFDRNSNTPPSGYLRVHPRSREQ